MNSKKWVASVVVAGFLTVSLQGQVSFVRSDANSDGLVNVTDVTSILGFLFQGKRRLIPCVAALDVNDNNRVELSDAIYLLGHLFSGGAPPPAPFPLCGPDPTGDELSCATFFACPYPLEELAGDASGVFFVVDRSGSMQNSGELQFAKTAISAYVSALGPDQEFGVVFFDRGILQFPSGGRPARATPDNIASGVSFVEQIRGGGGSCIGAGLDVALEMSNASSGDNNVIIYVGDGGGTCLGANERVHLDQTVERVAGNNRKAAVIHCIGVLQIGNIQEQFLRRLSEENGGRFLRHPR